MTAPLTAPSTRRRLYCHIAAALTTQRQRDSLWPMNRLAVALLAAALLAPGSAAAQYPLFDSHIHYSRPDWDTYTPEKILAILAQAGVKRALVSSTPDDGTLKLYDKAPGTIVPSLRVYRTRDDMSTWPRDPAIATYV